ncbi:hypothetical protein V5O48_001853 [Marasmius crinis-equi]|uniref:Ubiquitin-like protease family profile domain-containing protein n=1 Tax=Marasmius crinis-equi TaxID=585013 RepID=A0ABR3FXA7_9AGAR
MSLRALKALREWPIMFRDAELALEAYDKAGHNQPKLDLLNFQQGNAGNVQMNMMSKCLRHLENVKDGLAKLNIHTITLNIELCALHLHWFCMGHADLPQSSSEFKTQLKKNKSLAGQTLPTGRDAYEVTKLRTALHTALALSPLILLSHDINLFSLDAQATSLLQVWFHLGNQQPHTLKRIEAIIWGEVIAVDGINKTALDALRGILRRSEPLLCNIDTDSQDWFSCTYGDVNYREETPIWPWIEQLPESERDGTIEPEHLTEETRVKDEHATDQNPDLNPNQVFDVQTTSDEAASYDNSTAVPESTDKDGYPTSLAQNNLSDKPTFSDITGFQIEQEQAADWLQENIPNLPQHILVNNVPLLKADLARLREKSWINDAVINAFLGCYEFPPYCWVLTTLLWSVSSRKLESRQLQSSVPRELERNKDKFLAAKRVIIPIHNSSTNHWTTVAIEKEDGHIIVYDSLCGTEDKHQDDILRVKAWLTEMYQECSLDLFKAQGLQSNAYDCGAFTIANVVLHGLTGGASNHLLTQDLVTLIRAEVLRRLLASHRPLNPESSPPDALLSAHTSSLVDCQYQQEPDSSTGSKSQISSTDATDDRTENVEALQSDLPCTAPAATPRDADLFTFENQNHSDDKSVEETPPDVPESPSCTQRFHSELGTVIQEDVDVTTAMHRDVTDAVQETPGSIWVTTDDREQPPTPCSNPHVHTEPERDEPILEYTNVSEATLLPRRSGRDKKPVQRFLVDKVATSCRSSRAPARNGNARSSERPKRESLSITEIDDPNQPEDIKITQFSKHYISSQLALAHPSLVSELEQARNPGKTYHLTTYTSESYFWKPFFIIDSQTDQLERMLNASGALKPVPNVFAKFPNHDSLISEPHKPHEELHPNPFPNKCIHPLTFDEYQRESDDKLQSSFRSNPLVISNVPKMNAGSRWDNRTLRRLGCVHTMRQAHDMSLIPFTELSETVVKVSLRDAQLQAEKINASKPLHFLHIPAYGDFHTDIKLASDLHAYKQTLSHPLLLRPIPEDNSWHLVSTKDAFTTLHMAAEGAAIAILVEVGARLVFMLVPSSHDVSEAANIHYSLDVNRNMTPTWTERLGSTNLGNLVGWEVQGVLLRPGDLLIIPPGIYHFTYTLEPSICHERQLFCSSTIRQTCWSLFHTLILGRYVTDEPHTRNRTSLVRLMAFWYKEFVEGAWQPDLAHADDTDHVPRWNSITGLLDFLTLANVFEFGQVLWQETYGGGEVDPQDVEENQLARTWSRQIFDRYATLFNVRLTDKATNHHIRYPKLLDDIRCSFLVQQMLCLLHHAKCAQYRTFADTPSPDTIAESIEQHFRTHGGVSLRALERVQSITNGLPGDPTLFPPPATCESYDWTYYGHRDMETPYLFQLHSLNGVVYHDQHWNAVQQNLDLTIQSELDEESCFESDYDTENSSDGSSSEGASDSLMEDASEEELQGFPKEDLHEARYDERLDDVPDNVFRADEPSVIPTDTEDPTNRVFPDPDNPSPSETPSNTQSTSNPAAALSDSPPPSAKRRLSNADGKKPHKRRRTR